MSLMTLGETNQNAFSIDNLIAQLSDYDGPFGL